MEQKDNGCLVIVDKRGVENAINRFKKRVEKSKILDTYKKNMYYVKPSLEKREKRNGQSRARF